MVAPWQETQLRVVIEFKKGGSGVKRKIDLTHNAQAFPQQLYGRIDPGAWAALMADCELLAKEHPYMETASAECCANNCMAFSTFIVIGFGCFQGDAGDYDIWFAKVNQVLAKYSAYYGSSGCHLSLQHVHGSCWIQIDVNPMAVAVGSPAVMPVLYPGKY